MREGSASTKIGARPGERVLVAMSGGVDSSVAAARLRDAGFDVVGVTLHLWDDAEGSAARAGRCCAPEDQYDARRVADAVGFAHYAFDRRALFSETIVAPFVEAYLRGETPSPCSACNRSVKLGELFALADRLGAAWVATGHYARIVRARDRAPRLAMGADRAKDQSYFLYASPRAWLERLLFPLGEDRKVDVRAEARSRRLPGAEKGESQELCFVGPGETYADFVAARAPDRLRPGPIVDALGRTVGRHEGVHRFTVGQRRGLGVALGTPAFVARVDAAASTVHVGDERALLSRGAELTDIVLAEDVSLPVRARVRVRYRHTGEFARVVAGEDGEGAHGTQGTTARATFDGPVRAIAAGQIAVFYEGDEVLGGARIARAIGAEAAS